jgi:hypothetical protein
MTFETFPVAEEHVDSYAALISEKMLSQGFDISMADMDLISFEIRQDMAHPQLTDFLAKDSATGYASKYCKFQRAGDKVKLANSTDILQKDRGIHPLEISRE